MIAHVKAIPHNGVLVCYSKVSPAKFSGSQKVHLEKGVFGIFHVEKVGL